MDSWSIYFLDFLGVVSDPKLQRAAYLVLFGLLGFYLTVVVCQQPRRPENSSRLQLDLDADDILMPRQFL